MRIVVFSDGHGVLPENLPDCDLIIIGGDTAPVIDHSLVFQRSWYESNFAEWANRQKAGGIVLIGGNHDFIFEADNNFGNHLASAYIPNLIYLEDGMVEIYDDPRSKPIRIWGSPWSLNFGPWAFMTNEDMLATKYDDIPNDVDIIVSHTPPYRKRDKALDERLCGSRSLTDAIDRVQPRYLICGHIHEGYGVGYRGDTKIINCSIMDAAYEPSNLPIMVNF